MSETKHTPEPWEAKKGVGWFVYRPNAPKRESAIAVGMHPEISITEAETEAECEANCRRIVACVNACAGINPSAIPEMVERFKYYAMTDYSCQCVSGSDGKCDPCIDRALLKRMEATE